MNLCFNGNYAASNVSVERSLPHFRIVLKKPPKARTLERCGSICAQMKFFVLDEWDTEIDVLTTAHLLEQARRLQVPIPPHDDDEYWADSVYFGGRHLTPAGVTKLRSDVRAERQARWNFYSGHITLLIGLLGALIGVISILKK
jgi:hypothetical protein